MKQVKNSQIKSKKRVKRYAEVFTNEREVKAMCDLLPSEIWSNIESTVLEPACGNGNFIIEILARKYSHCKTEKDGLKALASVVGVDIQQDNVDECRERLLKQYIECFPNASEFAVLCAMAILRNNIMCDDFLNPSDKLKAIGFTPCEKYIKDLEKMKKRGSGLNI